MADLEGVEEKELIPSPHIVHTAPKSFALPFYLVDCFPQDILIFILGDLLLLIIGFDGKFYFLHCPLLRMKFFQVLKWSRGRAVNVQ